MVPSLPLRLILTQSCFFGTNSASSACSVYVYLRLRAHRNCPVFDRVSPTQLTLYISNADGSDERPLAQPGPLITQLRLVPPQAVGSRLFGVRCVRKAER